MLNTLLDADTLSPLVASEYELAAPIACTFLRRGFNDHYVVEAAGERYILRLYFQGKYYIESEADFRFELDLLDFLHSQGVPVANALRRRDGDLLGALETNGGVRHFALFSFAAGEIGKKPDGQLARSLGTTVASLHGAADRFHTRHPRYHLNLRYLVDEPMQRIEGFLREQGREGVDRYRPAVQELRVQIDALPTTLPAYGIIHGDMHGGNCSVTEVGELTFFDFDHGGYGWRAYDLATCKGRLTGDAWDAFLDGYEQVRRLQPAEIESIPVFARIRPIWDIGDVLAMRTAWGNHAEFGAKYADEIEATFSKLFSPGVAQ
jgi:Ser/Thr protein kinase RdoA (MazF antagonist)